MPRAKAIYTAAVLRKFEEMFLAGCQRDEIANVCGIYVERVKGMMTDMPAEKKAIRSRNLVRIGRTARTVRNVVTKEPSVEAWIDRDRRFRAPRTLTAEFFGDPRPGQSALDKL